MARGNEPKLEFDKYAWMSEQPLQTFEVVSGDGSVIQVNAHDISIGAGGSANPPILGFVRYEIRKVDVTKITEGTKSKPKTEVEETIDHPVMVQVASFNAGAWVSFRDVDKTDVTRPSKVDADGE